MPAARASRITAGCPARSSSSTTRPLLPFLLDQSVLLTGEVRLPGLYPILNDTGLDAVLAAAGGATDTADLSTVELAREPAEQAATLPLSRTLLDLRSRNFAAVRLSPRDAVRLPRGFGDRDSGPVTLVGEFVRPGRLRHPPRRAAVGGPRPGRRADAAGLSLWRRVQPGERAAAAAGGLRRAPRGSWNRG